jgi:hypothetical protein
MIQTIIRHNQARVIVVILSGLTGLAMMDSEAATTWTYPGGGGPCASTLQQCINGVAAGDTIQLAANTEILEFVTVDKSLVIEPGGLPRPSVQGVSVTASTADVDVTVRGIKATFWLEGMLLSGGGNLTLRVIDNVIESTQSEFAAVQVQDSGSGSGIYGTNTAIIADNVISQKGDRGLCKDAINVSALSAGMNATITGNQIAATDLSVCAGILASVAGSAPLMAFVDRNDISGTDFNAGVVLLSAGNAISSDQPPGALTAQVSNNRVVGQNGDAALGGGLTIFADASNAEIDALVLNNSFTEGRHGINMRAKTDVDARINIGFRNNLVSGNALGGCVLAHSALARSTQLSCDAMLESSSSLSFHSASYVTGSKAIPSHLTQDADSSLLRIPARDASVRKSLVSSDRNDPAIEAPTPRWTVLWLLLLGYIGFLAWREII